jgi:phosphate/sulfate permease
MELYYFSIAILFILAISDLMVGVANDAVNFLNSAVGSKVAPRGMIMIVAGVGILAGVTFSSGMMEVARKGIFNPDHFVMPELLVICIAVALTDLILLDLYNTYGLPTSTTVSIVFELLGATIAVSIIKIRHAGQGLAELVNYINTAKALAIISGILISIVVAFTVGAIVQYFTRLIFTFHFKKRLKRYGALWGGVALTFITYFILIKGAKGASFISEETVAWIMSHTGVILLMNFAFWAVLLQLLLWFTRVHILKPIVLIGTGALAMAFAANDLVNFIGVPLAGFHAFKIAAASGGNPALANMAALAGTVKTHTWMLLFAGAVMVATLGLSKKARTVTRTEVDLGRQSEEGDERFQASFLSRAIVGMVLSLSEFLQKFIPAPVRNAVAKRFDQSGFLTDRDVRKNQPSFDLVRASVNLMVASALISFATSLKLPLSTTYVTFMVAMGSSLSDRAWGRESAVYRISGVLTVIGGWFFTAFMASTVAFIFGIIIYHFRFPAIVVLGCAAAYFVVHTHKIHQRREKEIEEEKVKARAGALDIEKSLSQRIVSYNNAISTSLDRTFKGLFEENRKTLRGVKKEIDGTRKDARKLVAKIFSLMQQPAVDGELNLSPKVIGSLRESSRHAKDLHDLCMTHVENKHKGLLDSQKQEISSIYSKIEKLMKKVNSAIDKRDNRSFEEADALYETIKCELEQLNKDQIKRIKKGGVKTKQGLLYLHIISHLSEIVDQSLDLLDGYGTPLTPASLVPRKKSEKPA